MSTEKRKYTRKKATNQRRKPADENRDFIPTRPATLAKYRAVKARFRELFDVERRRVDDCYKMIMQEFFITSEVTVERMIRVELPEPEEA
jgi:hypothetical protein